jgi:glycosyltransferase involved in cell wall biosynthesis
MGKVTPIGDASALAEALIEVLSNHSAYVQPAEPIRQQYLPDTIAAAYEQLFAEIEAEIKG